MVGAARREVLLDLPLKRLQDIVATAGLPAYRAGQIFDWLHVRNVSSPEQMTDLPAALRSELAEKYLTWPMDLRQRVVSRDGSIKYGWLTAENNPVEAVLMPGFDYGTAVCVSSQSGCGMACGFCETGYMGLKQYLSAGEILQQLYQAEAELMQAAQDAPAAPPERRPTRSGRPGARPRSEPTRVAAPATGGKVDRIVFMGMGEPLANLRAVRRVIEVLTGTPGRGWSPRRITVSTVGIVQPIIIMARTFPRVNLALSLHFTTIAGRRKHMPQAESDPSKLAEALYFYRQVNGGKLTIEYLLMQGINDTEADARRLVKFARLSGLSTVERPPGPRPSQLKPGERLRENPAQSELMLEALGHEAPPNQQALPIHVNLIAYNPIPSANFQPTPERGIDQFARVLRDSGVPVTVRHSRGRDVGAACGQLGAEMLKGGG